MQLSQHPPVIQPSSLPNTPPLGPPSYPPEITPPAPSQSPYRSPLITHLRPPNTLSPETFGNSPIPGKKRLKLQYFKIQDCGSTIQFYTVPVPGSPTPGSLQGKSMLCWELVPFFAMEACQDPPSASLSVTADGYLQLCFNLLKA